MSALLETLVRLSTRNDLHELRALAPSLDRALMYKMARDRPSEGADQWLANRALLGDKESAVSEPLPCMHVIARYIDNNEYEADVAHALMHRMLYGSDTTMTARRQRLVSTYVITQLVRCGRTELLKRQFIFIRNNYKMKAVAASSDDKEAEEKRKEADLELQRMEMEHASLLEARTAKRTALENAKVLALVEACRAREISQKKRMSAPAVDEQAANACRQLGWASAEGGIDEASSSLADTERLLANVESEIVEAKRALARKSGANGPLLSILTQAARLLPFFDEMAESVPWCANVAGCLLRLALSHTNYNVLRALLECDEFYSAVPAAAVERGSAGAASALLKLFRKQRDSLRETVAHIPSAACDELARAELGFKELIVRHFSVLALVEQRARTREDIVRCVANESDGPEDETDDAREKRRAKIAYDLLCDKVPTLPKEQKMTSLQTLVEIDEALATALVALRSQLTVPSDKPDLHVNALARLIDHKLPDHDELVELPKRSPLFSDKETRAEASDSDADIDDKLPINQPREPLEVSAAELQRLLRPEPKRSDPTNFLDATVALVHALYRYRLVCLDERVSSTRQELAAAIQQTKEAKKKRRVSNADDLAKEVAELTAADYFGFDDDD